MKRTSLLVRRPRHFIEPLESRIAPAFISVLASATATFTGDAGADTLTITEAGGLLHHNRAGDLGFASDTDFDTTIAGDQTITSNSSGVINVNGGGGADVFNITYVGNLSVGSINMPLGTVNLTSTAGSVIMGSGAGAITATNLAVSANSGIGNIASPLVTAVANLEAQTSTQNILISNTGNLTIGGVSAGIAGVRALVSGNIELHSTGSITIQSGSDIVKTLSGDVLVDAIGATSDIQTGGNVERIDSDLGNVTVQAGRDVLLGNPATGFGDI